MTFLLSEAFFFLFFFPCRERDTDLSIAGIIGFSQIIMESCIEYYPVSEALLELGFTGMTDLKRKRIFCLR